MTSYSMLSKTKKSFMTVAVAWSGIVLATVLAFIFKPSDVTTGSLLLGVTSLGSVLFAYIFSKRVS
jgi:predicted neutral ceramidase superfamily lipid hydrolase